MDEELGLPDQLPWVNPPQICVFASSMAWVHATEWNSVEVEAMHTSDCAAHAAAQVCEGEPVTNVVVEGILQLVKIGGGLGGGGVGGGGEGGANPHGHARRAPAEEEKQPKDTVEPSRLLT